MRHSLTQLLSASSGQAAFSLPRDGSHSSAETGDEAEEPMVVMDDEAELLFPGLELDEWLAAAGPDWARDEAPEAGRASRSRPRPSGSSSSHRLKAAEAARLNRQRKKQYVQGLESRLQGLAAENRQLRERNRGLCRRLRGLEREAGYLRAVLANQSALGRLLGRLAGHGGGEAGVSGLKLSSSLWAEGGDHDPEEGSGQARLPCPESHGDHDYALPVPREEEDGDDDQPRRGPAGLCLHVDRGQVSVEFCSVCSRRAALGPSPSLAAKM